LNTKKMVLRDDSMILLILFLWKEKFFLFRSSLMIMETSKSSQLKIDFWDFWFKNLFPFQFEFYSTNKHNLICIWIFLKKMILLNKMSNNLWNKHHDHDLLCIKDYLKEMLENKRSNISKNELKWAKMS
jgi:hypothetical protein